VTYDQLAALRDAASSADRSLAASQAHYDQLVAQGASPLELRVAALALTRARLVAARADGDYRAALSATVGALDPATPVLLLPVRLETRFRAQPTGGGFDLLIRIYPDDVHVDSHEPGLIPAEVTAGQAFWEATWAASSAPERDAAWSRLVSRVGPTRAAWVARALTPTNAQTAGATPIFPTPALQDSRWTRPPRAAALPDQWIALAYGGGAKMAEAHGGLVTRPLATGLAPVDGTDPIDPAIQWMVDFAAAQQAGMGLVMSLTAPQADAADVLLVLGVRGTTSAQDSAGELNDLLQAHRYTWGLDLLPIGTPTNNTDAVRAPTSVEQPPAAAPPPPAPGSDVEALAAAFGLGGSPAPLAGLPGGDGHDQRDARDMATVLWPATWGYTLTQVMRPLFSPFPLDDWRRWMLDTVRGRGPLPALRVGDQPYGVLPVTSLDAWRPAPDLPDLLILRTVQGAAARTALVPLWDLGPAGGWTDAGGVADVPLPAGAIGAGLAALDLDADGQVEIVVGWLSEDHLSAGYAVYRIDGAGTIGAKLVEGQIPLASAASRLAVAVSAPAGGQPQLLAVVQYATTAGAPPAAVLLVGESLTATAPITAWDAPVTGSGLPAGETLLGTAAADLNLDGKRELIVLSDAGGVLRYRVGTGLLDAGAAVASWTAPVDVTPAGVPLTAGGVAFADVDHDGALELLAHYAWDGGGGVAAGAYRVGDQLDASGRPATWLGPYNTGSGWPGTPVGGGVACVALGRSPRAAWETPTARVNLLQRLREIWRSATAGVPRIGTGDPDQALLDLLATDATSASVAVRPVIGPLLAENLWFIVNNPLGATYQNDLAQRLAPIVATMGLSGTPRLSSFAYAPDVRDGAAPIGADQPTDYLTAMADATPRKLHDQWSGPGVPLLARLVRHSLLQAYADAAFRLVPVTGVVPPPPPEPELIDLPDLTATDVSTPTHTLTSWRHLNEATFNGKPVADVLFQAAQSANPMPEAAAVAEAIAAVRRLALLPGDALNRLLMETLDLSGQRLDAWLTSVATQRLRELRRQRPAGVQLGGYGIVTELRRATGAASTGYVHAPSLTHAATAAVLRSGYVTHGSAALAVDISSTRSRLALDLLDGVRSGQSLGALLGYRFERELADRGMSQYLPLLRQLAPEVVGQLTQPPAGAAVETVAALATVDGVALLRQWQAGAIPWGATVDGQSGTLPPANSADQVALVAALAAVQDAVDAVADVGLAESVHQTLQGNHLRAGGSLDALARGELPPPEPEVLRSPRSGVGLTHRLLLMMADAGVVPARQAWTGSDAQRALWVRSAAEPRLDAWAAAVLGDPARVRWRVSFVDATTGAASDQGPREHTLAEVGLSPLDLLYGPSPDVATLAETDLGRRLLAFAAGDLPGLVPVLLPGRADTWGAGTLSIEELLTVAELARDLVGGARAAGAQDLAPVGAAGPPGPDDELDGRAQATTAALAAAAAALRAPFQLEAGDGATLSAALAAPDIPADLSSLLDLPSHVDIGAACRVLDRPSLPALADVRAALTRISAFGVPGAAPRTVPASAGDQRAQLAAQARNVAAETSKRLTGAGAATDATSRIQAALGTSFRVLPVFQAANAADLTSALALRAAAGDAPVLAVEDWFEGVSRVRAGARRLSDVRLVAPAAGGDPAATLAPLQLPAREGVAWVGAPLPAGQPLPGGVTAITVATGPPWSPGGNQAGLVIDEWVEVVPSRAETTGLVFQYDAPDACAPQALLLAVSPDPSRPWDLATLEAIVLETADATRLRAVQPEQLAQIGHLLPALYFANNAGGDPAGDTVSTNFRGS
jgi:hypothetical protein